MSVNSVFLIGRLGAAPELRTTQTGKSVCSFRMATDRWRSDEEVPPDWHQVVVWERQADSCYKFLDRGSQVAIQGQIRTRKWERNGEPRYTTEVVARSVTFLGKPAGTQPVVEAAAPVAPTPPAQPGPEEVPGPAVGKKRGRGRRKPERDTHDDIPF